MARSSNLPPHAPAAPASLNLGPVFLLAGMFFCTFITRVIMAPLMPRVERDLGFSHAQAGAMFLYLAVGYCLSLLSSGLVSSRLGHRINIIVSTALVGLAMFLVALAPSPGLLGGALFLLGLAAGLYLPSGLSVTASLVPPQHLGRAMAVHEMAPNSSFVVAPLLAMLLLGFLSWRGAVVVMGLGSLAGSAYFWWRGGESGRFLGRAPDLKSVGALFRMPSFWILTMGFGLAMGATVGVYNMLPLYLINERGFSAGSTDFILAMSRVSGVFMSLAAGWASDRLGARRAMIVVMALCGLTTLGLGLAQGPWLVALVFLQPAAAVCYFPPGYAVLARMGTASVRPLVASFAMPLAFVTGGGLLPAGIGYLGEKLTFGWGIVLSGVLMLLGVWPLLKMQVPPAPEPPQA